MITSITKNACVNNPGQCQGPQEPVKATVQNSLQLARLTKTSKVRIHPKNDRNQSNHRPRPQERDKFLKR